MKEELDMSNNSNIYPMAFVPTNQVVCKLHYVGFPNAWKEKLIKVEKLQRIHTVG